MRWCKGTANGVVSKGVDKMVKIEMAQEGAEWLGKGGNIFNVIVWMVLDVRNGIGKRTSVTRTDSCCAYD